MKIPIGIDDFMEIRNKAYTYVDKTLLIAEILGNPAKVQLITRPRRFGKSLNMSMLAYFFDLLGNHRALFLGLAIAQSPSFEELGSRPVISLSFKGLKADDFKTFLIRFSDMMAQAYRHHHYLLATLDAAEQVYFQSILEQSAEKGYLMGSISHLMHWLRRHHAKKVVLLIDEYDSPINEAYQTGFYEPVITFMRGALGEALKGNLALHKAVLTGILRISKESIFSDLNHIEVHTVLDEEFAPFFGFTEAETSKLLKDAGQSEKIKDVQAWYNGYKIGDHIIYNPWSLLNYLKRKFILQPYWVNTSGNKLIYQLLTQADKDTQEALMGLINNGTVETSIHAQTSLQNLNGKALWSMLLFSGYLTVQDRLSKGSRFFYRLRIPNTEVKLLYQDIFMEWMDQQLGQLSALDLQEAFVKGDLETFQRQFSELIVKTMSFHDSAGKEPERVYHAFVLGLLANLDYRYHIRSNRESGYGRYDLMMIPKDPSENGVIMEFKVAAHESSLDDEAQAALAQIKGKNYAAELIAQGISSYIRMGIAFNGKQVAFACEHV